MSRSAVRVYMALMVTAWLSVGMVLAETKWQREPTPAVQERIARIVALGEVALDTPADQIGAAHGLGEEQAVFERLSEWRAAALEEVGATQLLTELVIYQVALPDDATQERKYIQAEILIGQVAKSMKATEIVEQTGEIGM